MSRDRALELRAQSNTYDVGGTHGTWRNCCVRWRTEARPPSGSIGELVELHNYIRSALLVQELLRLLAERAGRKRIHEYAAPGDLRLDGRVDAYDRSSGVAAGGGVVVSSAPLAASALLHARYDPRVLDAEKRKRRIEADWSLALMAQQTPVSQNKARWLKAKANLRRVAADARDDAEAKNHV